MLRRSARLLAQGYYDSYGQPIICYKETPYRSRKRRRVRPRVLDDGASFSNAHHPNVAPNVRRSSFNTSRWIVFGVTMVALPFLFTQLSYNPSVLNPSLRDIHEEIRRLRWKVDYLLPEAEFLPNIALASLGAKIMMDRTSFPYRSVDSSSFLCSLLSICPTVSPKVIIEESSNLLPGNCWSFAGEKGFITVSLPESIPISHITLGHISKMASPFGTILSAPKEFSVYGVKPGQEEGTLLGTFLYDKDGERYQTFKIADHRKDMFSVVKLMVNSNWGDPEYTCIYNFKVHGKVISALPAEIYGSHQENPPSPYI